MSKIGDQMGNVWMDVDDVSIFEYGIHLNIIMGYEKSRITGCIKG